MLYDVLLIENDPHIGRFVVANFQTDAVDRDDAIAQAPDDWPRRWIRASQCGYGHRR